MATAAAPSTVWEIDSAHSHVEFAVKHLMIATVKGRFSEVSGTISLNEANPSAAAVDIKIDSSSIDTRQGQRDTHLKSPDFLDSENYPHIEFKSTHLEGDINKKFKLIGDLAMHGVTKQVTLEVENQGRAVDLSGNEKAAFGATTKINRTDFGLNWNQALEAGGVLVGEEIKISIEIEASRQAPSNPA